MLPEQDLLNVLANIPLVPISGLWTRVLELRHLTGRKPDPLWSGTGSSRFSPQGVYRRIYLALDLETALKEVGAVFPNQPIRTPPWALIPIEGTLERVLDLTDVSIHQQLGTSIAELTGDWRYSEALHLQGQSPMPPTHLLGKMAFESGRVIGMRYHSAKNTGQGWNLVVFSDRIAMSPASFLKVYDPSGSLQQRLP